MIKQLKVPWNLVLGSVGMIIVGLVAIFTSLVQLDGAASYADVKITLWGGWWLAIAGLLISVITVVYALYKQRTVKATKV